MYPTFRRPADVVEVESMGASERSLASIIRASVYGSLGKVLGPEARAEPGEMEE